MQVILGTAHGSNVKGKQSPDGRLKEWKYSRDICELVRQFLEGRGIKAVIDIKGDTEKSIKNRVEIVNELAKHEDSIYVSIHVDAAGDGKTWNNASGFSVRIGTKASQKSKKLAECIFDVAEKENVFGNRYIYSTKWIQQDLYVCNKTTCPAVLTENMFQDNKEDVDFLLSNEGKMKIAKIHVEGIINYINSLK